MKPVKENLASLKNSLTEKCKGLKGKFSKLSKKQIRTIAIVLVFVIVASCFLAGKLLGKGTEKAKEIIAQASLGSVEQVIEGSGTISALSQYEITSLKKGEILEDFFEEGDIVQKDDVLYLMDDTDGYDAIDNASSSLSRAQRSYNKSAENMANLIVKSKTKGIITEMYISEGDTVSTNTKICDVLDNSNMVLEIQFLSEYASSMIPGVSVADVTLSKDGTRLTGTVTKVSTGSLTNSVGALVKNVEIKVNNPGAVKDGDLATAEVAGLACSGEGKLKSGSKTGVYAEVSGKVESLKMMKGDNIYYGQTVAILSNKDISDISESQDNLKEAQKKYDDAVEGLEDYVVKAPITGTIIQKNIKAGENLESSSGLSVMAIIADLSSLVFEMSVDELDISKLKVGMDVEVTADAIEGVTFGAKVTNISIVGTSNNGVTSYPVKITLNNEDEQTGLAKANYDKLIPGMNVSASVVIERVDNVIVVPVSAVRRGNIVIVPEDSDAEGISYEDMFSPKASTETPDFEMPSDAFGKMSDFEKTDGKEKAEIPEKQNNTKSVNTEIDTSKLQERMKNMIESMDIPKGYKAILVETGLSDETFIEIKRGLSEGDKVLLPDTTQSMQGGNFMGFGTMPGGMGGMPSMMPGTMPSGDNRNSSSQQRTGGGMR